MSIWDEFNDDFTSRGNGRRKGRPDFTDLFGSDSRLSDYLDLEAGVFETESQIDEVKALQVGGEWTNIVTLGWDEQATVYLNNPRREKIQRYIPTETILGYKKATDTFLVASCRRDTSNPHNIVRSTSNGRNGKMLFAEVVSASRVFSYVRDFHVTSEFIAPSFNMSSEELYAAVQLTDEDIKYALRHLKR